MCFTLSRKDDDVAWDVWAACFNTCEDAQHMIMKLVKLNDWGDSQEVRPGCAMAKAPPRIPTLLSKKLGKMLLVVR
jgi:hypothetical protein